VSCRLLLIDATSADERAEAHDLLGDLSISDELGLNIKRHINSAIEVVTAFALDDPPSTSRIQSFDGVIWGGSALSVTDDCADVRATRQWMKACFDAAKPVFGICYGLQLAVDMAGGAVEASPKGLEAISTLVMLTPEGEQHPMFSGRVEPFTATTFHEDHIRDLPVGATCMATNGHSDVQAAVFQVRDCLVWGVQYHPDIDIKAVDMLARFCKEQLTDHGLFTSEAEYQEYLQIIEQLRKNPHDAHLAAQIGFDHHIMDARHRLSEVQCWLENMVFTQNSPKKDPEKGTASAYRVIKKGAEPTGSIQWSQTHEPNP
jgi:GMP synthase (glutamine-hydrolysing)